MTRAVTGAGSGVLAYALAYRERGLSVIPVPGPRPHAVGGRAGDGKVPAIAWREFQSRLATEEELRRSFSRGEMNIAIVTGAISGVVVVDCDSHDALRWWIRTRPYTPWQTKTARGWHLFYRHPGSRVANRARLATDEGRIAIDVRGDGGYVIAPPSIHASGTCYAAAGEWNAPKEKVPVFWPGWLIRAPQARRPRCGSVSPPAGLLVDTARRYLASIPKPEIGSGSDVATLYAACRMVRRFNLSADVAEQLLWDWAGGRPGWTREWVRQKVENAVRYGTEPVGGCAS